MMKAVQYVFIRSSQPENVYGRFSLEILKSEGFNGFQVVDLDAGNMPELCPTDLLILTRCFLRDAEINRLCAAVEAGARLVGFQPSYRFAKRLGLAQEKRVLCPGWIKIRNGYPGAGSPIQTHIPLVLYNFGQAAGDWERLADAVAADWSESGHPVVVRRKMGQGQVVLFFYDLPMAVARIRFGNPELASYCTTGLWDWVHAGDLFIGQVDERVNHLPQADLHAQFLGKILTDLTPYPLPRIWYYEKPEQLTAAVFSSDDDMSKPEDFDALSAAVKNNRGGITFYLMKKTLLSEAQVKKLISEGHTCGPHVNPGNAGDEWYFAFPDVIKKETELYKEKFGRPSVSLQCHCAPWQGYMFWLPDFIKNGYRLLVGYTSLPIEMLNKYMCGSGRPIKFTGLDGVVHDCWQQPTVTYDDLSIIEKMKGDYDKLINEFRKLLDNCLNTHHTLISLSSHPKSYTAYSKPFFDPCLKMLRENDVPVYNGDRWCEFQDRRHSVEIRPEQAPGNKICYSINNLRGLITLMIPVKEKELKVTVNGQKTDGKMSRRLNEDYLLVALENNASENIKVDVEIF